MFAAQVRGARTQIVAYAERWDSRLPELRQMVASGELVCPGCGQSLWLRTGMLRRRHFAHRSLSECPLANQSAELLESKRQLFDWLEARFPGRVRYDSTVDGWTALPAADVHVEAESSGAFLYWVFDRQRRDRDRFLHVPEGGRAHVHYLHTSAALHLAEESELALTASQRDFMAVSDFDRATGAPHDGHLHFILPDKGMVRVYRGLRCVHAPQRYSWRETDEAAWSEAKISPTDGEIVLASDVPRWCAWRNAEKAERQRRLQAEADRQRRAAEDDERRLGAESVRREAETARLRTAACQLPDSPLQALYAVSRDKARGTGVCEPDTRAADGSAVKPSAPLAQSLRCEDCGSETTDWAVATPQTGTCVCRACIHRRWLAQQKAGGLGEGREG